MGSERSVAALERRCHEVCDRAWTGGVRWFDAARSYGRAEEFLATWLRDRKIPPGAVTVSSKWGYRYTAGWRVDADPPEVKDHSLAALEEQWPQTDALLGPWLRLYQVHSATLASGVLDDPAVHAALSRLGRPVGLTLSGPDQANVLRRALAVRVEDRPLFSAVQATWNLLEQSAAQALAEAKEAGWTVIVKEALANGRLIRVHEYAERLGPHPDAVALAAALAQPWADVVLSGAATPEQLEANLAACGVDPVDPMAGGLGMDPRRYWAERAAMPWT
jgi:aryl-alcohol dehydrogenase-like predicted oxidoreductase